MEYQNGYVTIHPRYIKLITAIRTAVENGEGSLDKEATSHYDLFGIDMRDSFLFIVIHFHCHFHPDLLPQHYCHCSHLPHPLHPLHLRLHPHQ